MKREGSDLLTLHVYAVHLSEELDKRKFNRMFHHLSPKKQYKVGRMLKYEDAVRSLVGELLVKYAIGTMTNLPRHEIRFGVNAYGKPVIDGNEAVCFNVSHSGDWVVCAIDSDTVGIDVEKIQKIDLQIARQFFSQAENEQLMTLPASLRVAYFFDIWTLKESLIKADGRGLSLPLDSFSIIKQGANIHLVAGDEIPDYHFIQYEIDPAYKLSICAKSRHFPDQVIHIDVDLLES
ncbi:4'-phosphopantetheinyl transferase family protein [Paenibacillus sedimenti]|uniref:4'-phosphopantetheinyl transferase superfamily protein n=1 Tax=Paenibacillus sedimenti TaxID=2770274 RepID=A0A926KKF1_9BACL|nr:4'-phosphopantetheinyl transferase superfamily protein [Paenibacillus sedimenti]MBD0378723.1 4'-phosphopantetheinyl transferase superfamily protein [Paenibacillus sedimenti]